MRPDCWRSTHVHVLKGAQPPSKGLVVCSRPACRHTHPHMHTRARAFHQEALLTASTPQVPRVCAPAPIQPARSEEPRLLPPRHLGHRIPLLHPPESQECGCVRAGNSGLGWQVSRGPWRCRQAQDAGHTLWAPAAPVQRRELGSQHLVPLKLLTAPDLAHLLLGGQVASMTASEWDIWEWQAGPPLHVLRAQMGQQSGGCWAPSSWGRRHRDTHASPQPTFPHPRAPYWSSSMVLG